MGFGWCSDRSWLRLKVSGDLNSAGNFPVPNSRPRVGANLQPMGGLGGLGGVCMLPAGDLLELPAPLGVHHVSRDRSFSRSRIAKISNRVVAHTNGRSISVWIPRSLSFSMARLQRETPGSREVSSVLDRTLPQPHDFGLLASRNSPELALASCLAHKAQK